MVAVLVAATFIILILVELARRQGREPATQAVMLRAAHFPDHPELTRYVTRNHLEALTLPSGAIELKPDAFLRWAAGNAKIESAVAAGNNVHEGEPLLRLAWNNEEISIPAPFTGEIEAASAGAVNVVPHHLGSALRKMLIGDETVSFWNQERERCAWFLGERLEGIAADGGTVEAGFLQSLDADARRRFRRRFCSLREE